MKKTTLFLCLVLLLLIFTMFKTKFYIKQLEKEINIVKNEIDQKTTDLQLLEAELYYLTTPSRIERLAQQHLEMHNIKPEQVVQQ